VTIPECKYFRKFVENARKEIFSGLDPDSVGGIFRPSLGNVDFENPEIGINESAPLILKVATKSIQVAHQDQFGDCDNKFAWEAIASDVDIKNLLSSSNRSLFQTGSKKPVHLFTELKEGEKYVVANPDRARG
jgi:hypothetical protein